MTYYLIISISSSVKWDYSQSHSGDSGEDSMVSYENKFNDIHMIKEQLCFGLIVLTPEKNVFVFKGYVV